MNTNMAEDPGNRSLCLSKNYLTKLKSKITSKRQFKGIQTTGIIGLVFAISVAFIPVNLLSANAASIDDINNQINQVTNNLNNKQAQVSSLSDQVAAIDSQIGALQAQIDQTQADIDQTTADIESLNQKIAANQAELKRQKAILNEYLRVIYEDSNTSAIEQIAGSKSFSDFVDQSEYLQTMQMKIKETVDQIKRIEIQLDQQKKELNKKMDSLRVMQHNQVLQQQGLNNQRALKDALLAKANAEAANLQGQLDNLYSQKAAMSAQFSESVMTGGSGGYPYGNPPAGNLIDTPDAYGYLIGECTSYAAWWRAAHGRPVPRAMGNAKDWAGMAGGGAHPGAVAVFPYIGGYGHVAIVEAVYGNGTILISEYNWVPYSYSSRVVNPYDYGIVYIN